MQKLYLFNFTKPIKNLPDFVKTKEIKKKKILVMSPHSDDISISCGGTIYSLSKSNEILPVLFFEGYRGVANKKKKEASEIREKEMERETKILKIKRPVFLRMKSYHKDDMSFFESDVSKIRGVLEDFKPDIVFLPKKDDFHLRHKLASKIALKAVKNIKNFSLVFYENPWSLFDNFEFNLISVFGKKALSQKLKAVRVHLSQIERTPFDKASKALAEFRAASVPEQRIAGYGKVDGGISQNFMEVFFYENNN